jgi:cell fate regulator YaaT (PSP1 superfamily)
MSNMIGVRFRSRGRLVYCDGGDTSLQVNDYVVVDTGRGTDVGRVVAVDAAPQPGEHLMAVVRRAEGADLDEARRNLETEALSKCHEMAAQLNLRMKPLAARYDLEAEQMTVFFSAEERVDFRDLVRKLSHALETRVQLRQVGARDEAKLLGSMGKCGYPLCCQNFLTSFASVSIKMAKEQSLALNPMKISGICGRLLCCLAYENKEYAAVKKQMPRPKQQILTRWGKATVTGINVMKETVAVKLDDGATREIALDDITHSEETS